MNKILNETDWIPFLKDYSLKNEDRPTRLGIFERADGRIEDLWVEDGLPLIAVDANQDKNRTQINIILDKYVHPIDDVVSVIHYSEGDGLDFVERSGRTTILRFEDWIQ